MSPCLSSLHIAGFLPVQDNKGIGQLQAKEKSVPPALPPRRDTESEMEGSPPPTLPPRRDTESEMEGSPPPPLPPPLSSEAVLELTYADMTQDEE